MYLVEKHLRPEPKVHNHRVNCAKRNTKVLLIKSYRDVLEKSINNINSHYIICVQSYY